jgi:hypothetical protein
MRRDEYRPLALPCSKRNHHARIERRLAEPTHIAAHDRLEIQALPHQPNDKPRDVVPGGTKSRITQLPSILRGRAGEVANLGPDVRLG